MLWSSPGRDPSGLSQSRQRPDEGLSNSESVNVFSFGMNKAWFHVGVVALKTGLYLESRPSPNADESKKKTSKYGLWT